MAHAPMYLRRFALLIFVAAGPVILTARPQCAEAEDTVDEEVVSEIIVPKNLVNDPSDPLLSAKLTSEGFLFLDRRTGEFFQRQAGCNYTLAQRMADGELVTTDVRFACDIGPHIDTTVTAAKDGSISYEFAIANLIPDGDDIATVRIPVITEDFALAADLPDGWRALAQEHWATLFPIKPDAQELLKGGKKLQGEFTSSFLPALGEIIVTSAPKSSPPLLQEEILGELNETFMREKRRVTQRTLIAIIPGIRPGHDVPARQAGVARIQADTELAFKGGLISNDSRERLDGALRIAQSGEGYADVVNLLADLDGMDPLYRRAVTVTLEQLGRVQ